MLFRSEYSIEVKDVEDKAGNKISKVTKKFIAKENEAVESKDINVTAYKVGESSQKLVVDFDRKMLADGSTYAINNLENYTIKVYDGDKLTKTMNLSDYHNAKIKPVQNNFKAEITLPGDKESTEDEYDFSKEGRKVKLVIARVADSHNKDRKSVV